MDIYSILNHKGGVGKSTISTNLAGYFANKGDKVLLGDFDVQQSSQNWLSIRNPNLKPIYTWEITEDNKLSTPSKDITKIIIDSPAGIRAQSLQKLVGMSDKIIIPLKPSMFDILSTEFFLEELMEIINSQKKHTEICIIGNMVDLQTKATQQLLKFIEGSGIASPTHIKQSQIYIHLAAYGLTLFDSQSNLFEKHIQDWQPLIDWVEHKPNVNLTKEVKKAEEPAISTQSTASQFGNEEDPSTPFPVIDEEAAKFNPASYQPKFETVQRSQFDYVPSKATDSMSKDDNFVDSSVTTGTVITSESIKREPGIKPSWFMDTVRDELRD